MSDISINTPLQAAKSLLPNMTLEARAKTPAEPTDTVTTGSSTVGDETLSKIPDFAKRYFTDGNKVTPMFDPEHAQDKDHEIFAQVSDMIAGAKKSVQIEMFDLAQPGIVDLLCKDVQRGVKVQVIEDPNFFPGDTTKKEAMDALRKGGVEFLTYPTLQAGDPKAKFGQIDHVKLLMVDGKQAIIGGMNWDNHSPKNHDYDVKVEGPAVEKMEWMFREDWLKSGGTQKDLPYIEKVAPNPDANAMVNLTLSSTDDNEKTIGKTVHRAIQNAKKSIHAELFVLTERQTLEALIKAHQDGKDVKIILNPLKIKDNAVNDKAFQELKDAGVPVKWYDPDQSTAEKLHSKTAVFDDDQSLVGSANWSYAGFNVNREADVEVLSKEVNSQISAIFDKDWTTRTSDEPHYVVEQNENPGG